MTTDVISGYGRGPGDTCDGLWEMLSAYADGLTSPAEAARVERHVSACTDCARDLAFMRETAQLLARTPELEPPAALRDAILAATIHRPTKPTLQQRLRDAARRLVPATGTPALVLAGSAAALLLAAWVSVEALKQPPSATAPTQLARAPRTILPPANYIFPSHELSSPPLNALPSKAAHSAAPRSHDVILAARPADAAGVSDATTADRSSREKRNHVPRAAIEMASINVPGTSVAARARAPKAPGRRSAPREVAGPHRSSMLAARPDRAPAPDDLSPKLQPERDFMPSDMTVASADMMTTAPMDPMSPMGTPMDPTRAASTTASGESSHPHVILAVSPAPPSTGSVVSLADLRRKLRHQTEASLGAHQELHLRSRRELLDVLKSSF